MALSDAPLHENSGQKVRLRLRVRGVVQGVGFRPFVYKLAQQMNLTGWVLNDAEGVLIELEGGRNLSSVPERIRAEAPPLARVDSIESMYLRPEGGTGFEVRHSASGPASTMVGADACVCDDCLQEMFDPANRRFLYPFLNCTNCGPRYTITRKIPYDRQNTSMAGFPLCAECEREYSDPLDRRFHAQPTACPVCGPSLSHEIAEAWKTVAEGGIVALKGIGGFHLICDATNSKAVQRLRDRKTRDAKPFAVMTLNAESARHYAKISACEERLLTSQERPIVLCARDNSQKLADEIAPGLSTLGMMLPYTPMHFLLFHQAAGEPYGTEWLSASCQTAFVVTSANPGGEPLVIGNEEAHARLSGIADLIIDHDRDILIRNDDSVVRVINGAPAYVRRGRGLTPNAIRLSEDLPSVLALGGHLKNTVCLTRGREAFLSQHIGDMDTARNYDFLLETIDHLTAILDVKPQVIACDQHPDFLTTRLADSWGLPVMRIQHHHAHIASVAAEHGHVGPMLGLALDGYGYGEDGGAWGGELLLMDGSRCERLGHLQPVSAPGGDRAAKEPYRMAIGVLHSIERLDLIETRFGDIENASVISALLDQGQVPETSSCGRLFDAAASLLDICHVNRFEGEAAMRLEARVTEPVRGAGLWQTIEGRLSFLPLLNALADLDTTDREMQIYGANLFHGALIDGLAALAAQATDETGVQTIALSGGCLLNGVLAEGLQSALQSRGLTPLYPQQAPANDGGLSLGQALIAGRKLLQEN